MVDSPPLFGTFWTQVSFPTKFCKESIQNREENVFRTSLNYNCDKVESKEGGLRRDGVENKDLLDRDGEREGEGEGEREAI